MSCFYSCAAGAVAREEKEEDHAGHPGVHHTGIKGYNVLECLTWAVYNNLLAPGQSPPLSGFKSHGQVVQCLVDKMFKGLHSQCPAHTSVVFKSAGRLKSIVMVPRKSLQPKGFPMTWNMREEIAKGDQATTGQLDPVVNTLKWMQKWQCLYTDEHLNFWLLLWPLTNGSEVLSQHLVHRLLSIKYWVLALDPPTYPPMPSTLNIGHWIREDCKVSEWQKWIEAFVCTLQHVDEASIGHTWTTEDKNMTPQVSKLVEMFLAVTRMHIPSCMIRKCWPAPQDNKAQQNLQGVHTTIIRHLDEVVTHQPSLTVWDSFTFPMMEEEHWKEECLSYYPGKVVNIGPWMPRIWLMVQNTEGHYGNTTCTLLYEWHMLVYDLARIFSEWVPMRGMSVALTSMELRLANDLNNICPNPHSEGEPSKSAFP